MRFGYAPYDREGVKFRDSSSEIEYCETSNLPHFARASRRHKLVAPKDFYLDQNKIPLTLISHLL